MADDIDAKCDAFWTQLSAAEWTPREAMAAALTALYTQSGGDWERCVERVRRLVARQKRVPLKSATIRVQRLTDDELRRWTQSTTEETTDDDETTKETTPAVHPQRMFALPQLLVRKRINKQLSTESARKSIKRM